MLQRFTPSFFYSVHRPAHGTMEPTRSYQDIAFPPCGHLGVLLHKPATHGSLLKV